MSGPALESLSAGAPVLVAGGGVTGRAVLTALSRLGATATLCDDDPTTRRHFAEAGRRPRIRPPPRSTSLTTPWWSPAPVSRRPRRCPPPPRPPGVPVWGDVELAWRLDQAGHYGPPRRWLAVTGTNGKTTTTSMLHAMLVAAGVTAACAATSAARCWTCCTSPPTCWPSSCPAFSCTGRRRCDLRPGRCSTSPKIIWTGTAPWTTTPRQGRRAARPGGGGRAGRPARGGAARGGPRRPGRVPAR